MRSAVSEPRSGNSFQDRARVRPCSCCYDRHPWRIDAPGKSFRCEARVWSLRESHWSGELLRIKGSVTRNGPSE